MQLASQRVRTSEAAELLTPAEAGLSGALPGLNDELTIDVLGGCAAVVVVSVETLPSHTVGSDWANRD